MEENKIFELFDKYQDQWDEWDGDSISYTNFEKAIKEALRLHLVSQQRELLRSYNKFVNEKCLLAGGVLSDFEIEKFEERNCG
jgi:hypothetical protein